MTTLPPSPFLISTESQSCVSVEARPAIAVPPATVSDLPPHPETVVEPSSRMTDSIPGYVSFYEELWEKSTSSIEEFESASGTGGSKETPAVAQPRTPTAGAPTFYVQPPEFSDISDVHQIFHFADRLQEGWRDISMLELRLRGFDQDAFLADLEERPLFLRNAGYLR